MNRHHPYGGGYENPGRRGGPPGSGPDRSHRFSGERGGLRGRGGFRGRGGGPSPQTPNYPSYNDPGPNPYDQGHIQGDYNGYAVPPPQDPYSYQNYPPSGAYPPVSEQPGPYQDYPTYEDQTPSYSQGGFNDQQSKRPIRRDDKVHDMLIEERIGRERPCRTLFIRNIKYETHSDDVRQMFEEHGDIKTFFDLIANRGMVFVTYYDIRAAERARERLQGSEISGRPIDVHYSLPRDDSKGQDRERNQALQGILIVSLRNSASGQLIDDNEVRRKFQQFGDVKSVTTGERSDERLVEFYDTRAAEEAYDRLRHQGLQDGVMDIAIAWDAEEQPRDQKGMGMREERNIPRQEWEDRGGRRGRGRGRGRGGRNSGGPPPHDEWDRRPDADEYGRDRRPGGHDGEYNGGTPPTRGNRFEGRGRGRGGRGQNYDYSHGRPAPDYSPNQLPLPPPPPHTTYSAPPQSVTPSYSQPAPPPPAPPVHSPPAVDDRLEQARKVQQLLAALKQPGSTGGTPQPPTATTPQPPPAAPQYYQQPPAPYPGVPAQYPSQQPPVQGGLPSGFPGLPPNLLAALQAVPAQGGYPPMGPPPMSGGYGVPPSSGPAPTYGQPPYQSRS